MSRKQKYGLVISTFDRFTRSFPKALPSIKVPVSQKPIRLHHPTVKTAEGRFIIIQKYLTSLFRDERIEGGYYRLKAIRPYAERLIQLGIAYGNCHKPTMDVCDYWLQDKELIRKLFEVYVPRYHAYHSSYTEIYKLPTVYGETLRHRWSSRRNSVLEMKGNPYPPVVLKPENHTHSLLNILLNEARRDYQSKKRAEQKPED